MRLRLIEATLDCIAQEGYTRTTVSHVIARAGASRGALLHHFPSKALLIEATVEHLTRRVYKQLGDTVASLMEADDRLDMLLGSSFDLLMGSRESAIFQELLTASRTDAELLVLMKRLGVSFLDILLKATRHYFERAPGSEKPEDLILLTQWVLRGMAGDAHLMEHPQKFKRYLSMWVTILRSHLQAKPGVNTLPPKPKFWEEGLG